MPSEQLFVYGTLRPPQPDSNPDDSRYYSRIAPYLKNVTPACLPNADLYDLGTYPGARPGKGKIIGEILTIAPAALDILDQIEGHPHFFYRERVVAETPAGKKEAWIYYAPDTLTDGQCLISNGDWLRRGHEPHPSPDGVAVPTHTHPPTDPVLTRVMARLVKTKQTWLATTRPDGRSRLRTTQHIWHNGRMYVLKHTDSDQLQDILQNPAVTLAHPSAKNPITLEGWATPAQAVRAQLRPLFIAQYGIDIEKESFAVVDITPIRLRARGKHGEGEWRGSEMRSVDEQV